MGMIDDIASYFGYIMFPLAILIFIPNSDRYIKNIFNKNTLKFAFYIAITYFGLMLAYIFIINFVFSLNCFKWIESVYFDTYRYYHCVDGEIVCLRNQVIDFIMLPFLRNLIVGPCK